MRRIAVLSAALLVSGLPVGVSSVLSMTTERGPVAVAVAVAQAPAVSAAAGCGGTAGGSDDVNGDLKPDVVVGDPGATVAGRRRAGLVQVRYGVSSQATRTKTTLFQGEPRIGQTPEAGDRFGAVIAVGLVDGDHCADVVISAPGENLGTAKDAGLVHIVFGSAAGLGRGKPSLTVRAGSAGLAGNPADGEKFGSVLALQDRFSRSSEPRSVAIGVPLRKVGAAPMTSTGKRTPERWRPSTSAAPSSVIRTS